MKKTKVVLGPAIKDGLKTNSPPKAWNIVVLGEVNRQGKLVKHDSLVEKMNQRFEKYFKKDPKLKETDLKALEG